MIDVTTKVLGLVAVAALLATPAFAQNTDSSAQQGVPGSTSTNAATRSTSGTTSTSGRPESQAPRTGTPAVGGGAPTATGGPSGGYPGRN